MLESGRQTKRGGFRFQARLKSLQGILAPPLLLFPQEVTYLCRMVQCLGDDVLRYRTPGSHWIRGRKDRKTRGLGMGV